MLIKSLDFINTMKIWPSFPLGSICCDNILCIHDRHHLHIVPWQGNSPLCIMVTETSFFYWGGEGEGRCLNKNERLHD